MGAPPNHQGPAAPKPSQIRAFAADAGFAFAGALLVALVLASLSASGVMTMALARILLVVAWITGVILTYAAAPVWKTTRPHKFIFSVTLACFLFAVERYETAHQPRPSSAAPTADQIALKIESKLKYLAGTQSVAALKPASQPSVSVPAPNVISPHEEKHANLPSTGRRLYIECKMDFLPAFMPSNGQLFVYSVLDDPLGSIHGMEEDEDVPLTRIKWTRPDSPAYRCLVLNYDRLPVVNIGLTIPASYLKVTTIQIDGRKAFAFSPPVKGNINLDIDRVSPGEGNPFIFYMTNSGDWQTEISLPNVIKVARSDGLGMENIPLIATTRSNMTLSAKITTNIGDFKHG